MMLDKLKGAALGMRQCEAQVELKKIWQLKPYAPHEMTGMSVKVGVNSVVN